MGVYTKSCQDNFMAKNIQKMKPAKDYIMFLLQVTIATDGLTLYLTSFFSFRMILLYRLTFTHR
jgi:hypothetical protein